MSKRRRPRIKCATCPEGWVGWRTYMFGRLVLVSISCGVLPGQWGMQVPHSGGLVAPHWCPRLPQPMLPGMMEVGR